MIKLIATQKSNITSFRYSNIPVAIYKKLGSQKSRVYFAFLTPIFLTLSFPRYNLSLFVWFALIPLLIAVRNLGYASSFLLSWAIGILSSMGIFFWINQVNKFSLPYFLLAGIYLGIYMGLFVLFSRIFKHNNGLYPIFIASLWVCIEYLRSNFFFLAFPWALLGHSQFRNINLIQISSVTGVYGLSFLIVLVNVCLIKFFNDIFIILKGRGNGSKMSHRITLFIYLGPIFLIAVSITWGRRIRKRCEGGETIRVCVVQGNIPQEVKWKKETLSWTIDRYENLTRRAAQDRPQIIIWPETSIPVDLRYSPKYQRRVFGLARELATPLVFGASGSAKIGGLGKNRKKVYNSAFYITSEGLYKGEYQKMKLLPFGEYVPSIGKWSLESLFPELKSAFAPGGHAKIFPLQAQSFGVTICWENIFPDLFRRFVLKGATFMINISNDAWFKDSAGPYQHLMCQIFRAVENRISIARAANTGISCFISPSGEIIREVTEFPGRDIDVAGIITDELPLFKGATFYTHYGDVFAFFCILMLALGILLKLINKIFQYKKGISWRR